MQMFPCLPNFFVFWLKTFLKVGCYDERTRWYWLVSISMSKYLCISGLNILQRYIKGDKDIHNRATVFVGIFNEYIQEFEKNENSVSYSIYYGEVINCTTFEQYTKLCAYHGVASYVGKQRGFARFREHDSNRETVRLYLIFYYFLFLERRSSKVVHWLLRSR
jgi:hypothetical protein